MPKSHDIQVRQTTGSELWAPVLKLACNGVLMGSEEGGQAWGNFGQFCHFGTIFGQFSDQFGTIPDSKKLEHGVLEFRRWPGSNLLASTARI